MLCVYSSVNLKIKFLGRRPFKRIKTDDHFAKELLIESENAFQTSLLENVRQELYSHDYSRITDLKTNKTTDLHGFLCPRTTTRQPIIINSDSDSD